MRSRLGFCLVLALILAPFQSFSPAAIAQESPVKPSGDSDAALRTYRSAAGMLNRGLHDLAAAEYRKFLDVAPQHEKAQLARYGLAVCLIRLEKTEEALKALQDIDLSRDFAYRAETRALIGQCQLTLGRTDQAVESLEKMLADHGDHELADDAAGMLIEAQYQRGKFADVRQLCDAFLRQWPKSPIRDRVELLVGLAAAAVADHTVACEQLESWLRNHEEAADRGKAWLALAQARSAQRKHDNAAEAFRQAIGSKDAAVQSAANLGLAAALRALGQAGEAAALVENVLKGDQTPSDVRQSAQMERARLLLDSQRVDDAQREFDAVETASAGDSARASEAAYWAAKCSLRKGAHADAAQRLAIALEKYEKQDLAAEMRYDRAVALLRASELDQAAVTLDQFREQHAKHELAADALHLSAIVEQQRRQYDRSSEHCRAFQRRFAKHELAPRIAFLAAENEFLAGNFEQAVAAYSEFLRAFPKDAMQARAELRIGLALHRLNRADEALPRLSKVAAAVDGDKAMLPALQALGDLAFQRGEWKTAGEHLKRFIDLSGKDAVGVDDALLKIGLAHARENACEDALKHFDLLLERFPQSAHRLQALFERGQALAMLQRNDAAREALERVLAEGKDSRFIAPARQMLASLAAANRDFKAAAEQYKLAMDANPEASASSDAQLGRAESLLALGDFSEAEGSLRQFIQQNPKSPKGPRALAQLAIALSRQERYADALKVIAAAEQRASKLDPNLRRSIAHEKAWCLRKTDKAAEAKGVFEQLLRDEPRDAVAAVGLAEIEAAAGECEVAVKALTSLVAKDAPAIEKSVLESGLYRFGACQYELGKHAEAVEALQRFVADFGQSPLLASASYFLGDAQLILGKADAAAESLARAAQSDDPGLRGPALLRLGEAQAAGQRWAKSEQAFAEYLERFQESEFWGQARFGQGWARENLGRLDEAMDAYRDVVEKHKSALAARAQFQIGECLFAKKQFEDAARELLKVDILFNVPEWSAAALFEAGRCFEQMNKTAEAKAQYSAVVEKHKGTKWAELSRQRLGGIAGGGAMGK